MTTWFKRNDGQLFEAEDGSAQFELMSKSGDFEEVLEFVETAEGKKLGLTGKPELWKDDESDAQTQQPSLENAGTKSDSQQSGSGKRGRTRKGNQTNDS